MKALVVGGDITPRKESKIAKELSFLLEADLYNGILPQNIYHRDLVIWMPNIPNKEGKNYPHKDKGAILICSKVMREGYTRIDSVSRIFKMHGNAVIEIRRTEEGVFTFQLVDALGNEWMLPSDNLKVLSKTIMGFVEWTKGSIRRSLSQEQSFEVEPDLQEFYEFTQINQQVALSCAEGCGNRFFGNYSTRCTKLFPSHRLKDKLFAFSPRNIDKRFVTAQDMVICSENEYYGDRKPSVDTPVQLEIYKAFPNINYMIHGHAYIQGAANTPHYYPCGDLREVDGIIEAVNHTYPTKTMAINLYRHGFLILSETLEGLNKKWRFYSLND